MTHLDALALGLVQGLTEFLPVSSSGHLVLAREILGLRQVGGVTLEVVVHLATLLSVLVVLRRSVWQMIRALRHLARPGQWRSAWIEERGFRRAVLLLPATLPAAAVGLALKDRIEEAFQSPNLVAWMLMVTALVLLLPLLRRDRSVSPLGPVRALTVGCAQAVAVIPGISRSGSTISAGLLAGLDREEAGEFSFLLAIPAILGAGLLEARHLAEAAGGVDAGPLLSAGAAAFVSGTASLWLLLRLVRGGRLWLFSPYLVLAALAFLAS